MHYLSFLINLFVWTSIGIIVGHFVFRNLRKKENLTALVASLGSLFGGMFSFATHGMWVETGVDFFNFLVALIFSFVSLFLLLPESREVFYNLLSKIINPIFESINKTKGASGKPYFTPSLNS